MSKSSYKGDDELKPLHHIIKEYWEEERGYIMFDLSETSDENDVEFMSDDEYSEITHKEDETMSDDDSDDEASCDGPEHCVKYLYT
jgi:hypothetical protein